MSRSDETTIAPVHHPLIGAHAPRPVERRDGCAVEFLGIHTRLSFDRDMPDRAAPSYSPVATPEPPGFGEEYFEWVDLFEAVSEAHGHFVMAELGAGYGRWLVRGAAIARMNGRGFAGIAVEAEPDHCRWIWQHCRDNGIPRGDVEVIWAAVDSEPGFVPFTVGRASGWYGQGIRLHSESPFPDARARRALRARSVLGRPPSVREEGVMWVPRVTLGELLVPHARVDLVDIDVQGLELAVLESAIDELNTRVRRIHIGTHSSAVERDLRQLFRAEGWLNRFDYPSHTHADTPYGPVAFADGVQTWLNPRQEVTRQPDLRVGEGATQPLESGRVKSRVSRLATLRGEVKRLEHRVQRLRQKNAALKEKYARARERPLARNP